MAFAPTAFAQLRPLSFGEILDGAFTLYRRQFASMFLTALIPQIPMLFWWGLYGYIMTGMTAENAEPTGTMIGALIVMVALLPVVAIATVVGMGGVVFQVSRAYTGTPVGTREALRRGWQRLLPLTGALLVMTVMAMIGFLLCLVPGFAVMLASFAVIPAVVLERRGPIAGIERSFNLIKGAWLEVFLVVLVAWMITSLPGAAVGMLSLAGMIVTEGDPQAAAGIQAGTQVLSALVRTITVPFSLGCTVLLYYDRRVRTEALDVQMMAESLNATGGETPAGGFPGGGYGQGGYVPGGYGPGGYPAAPGYAGDTGYPGANAYPAANAYPGVSAYPGTNAYPGKNVYPGTPGFPDAVDAASGQGNPPGSASPDTPPGAGGSPPQGGPADPDPKPDRGWG